MLKMISMIRILLFLDSFEALFREDSPFYCHGHIQQYMMVFVESCGLFVLVRHDCCPQSCSHLGRK